jgi:hypothetical protein
MIELGENVEEDLSKIFVVGKYVSSIKMLFDCYGILVG